jgi:hypothetical protein
MVAADKRLHRGGAMPARLTYLFAAIVLIGAFIQPAIGHAPTSRHTGTNGISLSREYPDCGKPVEPDWRACPYCGNAVDGGGAQGGPTIEVGDDSVVKESRRRQGKKGESKG